MVGGTDKDVHEAIRRTAGLTRGACRSSATADVEETLEDVQKIRASPFLGGLEVGGFVYDVRTGRLSQVC